MSTKIRLTRLGKKNHPMYRIVVIREQNPRNGIYIENIGYYHPQSPSEKSIKLNKEKILEWIKKGAQPTTTVKKLFAKGNIFEQSNFKTKKKNKRKKKNVPIKVKLEQRKQQEIEKKRVEKKLKQIKANKKESETESKKDNKENVSSKSEVVKSEEKSNK